MGPELQKPSVDPWICWYKVIPVWIAVLVHTFRNKYKQWFNSSLSGLFSVCVVFRHVTGRCCKSHQTLWENKHHVSITPFLLLCSFSTCSPCCRRLIPNWQMRWGNSFLSEASSVSRFRLGSRLPPLLFIVVSISTPEILLRVWISTVKDLMSDGDIIISTGSRCDKTRCHTHPHSVQFSCIPV